MLKFLIFSLLIISIIILYCNIPSIAEEVGMTPLITPNKLLPTLL
jgi:hypothetical protein